MNDPITMDITGKSTMMSAINSISTEKKPLEEIMPVNAVGTSSTPRSPTLLPLLPSPSPNPIPRWDFPSKQNPDYKNGPALRGVGLWAKNLLQKDMLRVLTEEDGFDTTHRELMRVRSAKSLAITQVKPAGLG
ncbi:hypothetical protein PG987_016593 [Apiospora arundinis]